ncbi:MAG: tetratricopeptide repeat protein [Deltaproteobacteria bacterium]|nr:tetratricopeptide repeat protein [Deltaproteobacteria bacterium]
MPEPRPQLGLVMIVRDEAANLPRSLAPLAGLFDEVVVVDTGSRDATPALCRELGATVYDFPWRDDFAAARNFGLDRARAAWLFWLDADNALPPAEVPRLRALLRPGPAILWAQEQVVPSGERLWQKRCFPNNPAVRFRGRVHEQLAHPPSWPNLATPLVIQHWGYEDLAQVKAKGAYYQGLLQQMLQDDPGDFYAKFQLARCHYNLRDFPAAASLLAELAPDATARAGNPQIWLAGQILRAQAQERAGAAPAARHTLERLLEIMPGEGLAHYHRGRQAYVEGDWPRAREHLTRALDLGLGAPMIDLDPERTLFLASYYLGRALAAEGRPAEAAQALARAVERDPANPAARAELAEILMQLGQPDAARQQVAAILEQRPGDRRARDLLAALEARA